MIVTNKMRNLFIFILFFVSINAVAQDSPIRIIFDAKITQVESLGDRLDIARVKLFNDNNPIDSVITQKGRCFFDLDTGHVYKIEFSKTGYVSKFLVIDTHGIPKGFKKKSKVKVDVGLFTAKKMLDVGFLKEKPIGIASYDFVMDKIEWNRDYTKLVVEELIKATLDYTDKKEKGKRKSL